jgi:hypothetical protein
MCSFHSGSRSTSVMSAKDGRGRGVEHYLLAAAELVDEHGVSWESGDAIDYPTG